MHIEVLLKDRIEEPPRPEEVLTVAEVVDSPESLHFLALKGEKEWLASRFNPIALCA